MLSVELLPPDVTGVHGGRTLVHVNAFGHVELDKGPPRTGKLIRNIVPRGRVQRRIWELAFPAWRTRPETCQRDPFTMTFLPLTRTGESQEGNAARAEHGEASVLDIAVEPPAGQRSGRYFELLSEFASVGPPGPGLIFARARSIRDLGRIEQTELSLRRS